MTITRTIAVTTHGHYHLAGATTTPSKLLLIGCHGYAENAGHAFERLRGIPGAAACDLVAIEGLNRFYRGRSRDVVASWMTRENRELMIADNIAYVNAVVDAARRELRSSEGVAFAGFSQGVAMAFRAACLGAYEPAGIIALGGDVPPDIPAERLQRARSVLLGRGADDTGYTAAKFEADQERLQSCGVDVTPVTIAGGHDWTDEFSRAAGEFISRAR